MRSSALAGFLASAVFVSGSAGFASTFLVGPYLGEHLRHQPSRATLKATVAPVDPLVALQIPGASVASGLEGEPPASQKAHRLRNVENKASQAAPVSSATPAATPVSNASAGDVPAVTEEAFAPTAPSTIPAASGGPLIATETTSAMVSSKLENGEPVLTLRIAPVVTASAPAVDAADPDNAVEPTIISAPPSEQALATPAVAATPVAAPVTAPVEPQRAVHPRVKPALRETAPTPVEPAHRPAHTRTVPARVTTVAAPAKHTAPVDAPLLPATSDPLNAAFTPSTPDEPVAPAPSPSPAPAQPAATGQPQSTGGPTPLVMPQ